MSPIGRVRDDLLRLNHSQFLCAARRSRCLV